MAYAAAATVKRSFKSRRQFPIGSVSWTRHRGALLLVLAICVAFGLPALAAAQAAQFLGYQTVPATGLSEPIGVAVDKAGDLYVANFGTPYLVKIPAGGGTATPVTLPNGDFISAVAVDSANNVYVGLTNETDGYVYKMPAGSSATATQIGSGWRYPSGIAVDSSGDVFVADEGLNKVYEFPAGSSQLTLNFSIVKILGGIAVDGNGNVFVSDSGAKQVAELRAGTSSAISKSVPDTSTSVAVDAAGNVFATLANSTSGDLGQVVELPVGGGSVITLGVTGVKYPEALTVDSEDNLFIADTDNNRVVELQTRAVDFASANVCPGSQTTPAPCSATLALNFSIPAGGDIGVGTVLTLGAPNLDFTLASGGTCTGHIDAGGTCTVSITFKPKAAGLRMGVLHITDDLGNVLATTNIYGTGIGPQLAFPSSKQNTVGSGFSYPIAVAVDGAGDTYVVDNSNSVYEVPAGGGKQTTIGSGFSSPYAVAVDGAGNVYIADAANQRVVELPADGGPQTTVGERLQFPVGVAVDGAGNVFILDLSASAVYEVPASGAPQISIGSGLLDPQGIAVDAVGDVFIADTANNRVVEVPADGTAQTTVVDNISGPSGIAVDAAGSLYIAEGSNVLEVLVGTGTHTTVGTGLSAPSGVAVDSTGNVFIADYGNARVIEVPRSQPPALAFAATETGKTSTDSPQTIAMTNIGNQPLTFSALTFPADFPEGSSLSSGESFCETSNSLAVGGLCNLPVDFTPAHAGALSESLTLTDNTLNAFSATQTVTLTGTGLGSGTPAAITSPAPSGTLTGSSVTFSWSAGTSVTEYFISIGSTGVGSRNLYAGAATTARSASVTGLPTDATTIYVRLGSKIAGVWEEADYTYTAASIASALTSPTPGTELAGSSATFKWTAIGSSDDYFLSLGTKGVGSNNLYNPGATTATSASVTGLPTNGVTIYARLGSKIKGVWKSVDYTYTSAATPAALASPAPGSTLSGSAVTFTWTAGTGVTEYFLSLGSTGVGSNNLYNPGATTAKSASVTGLPTNGETIYARLGSKINGVWHSVDYTYKAE